MMKILKCQAQPRKGIPLSASRPILHPRGENRSPGSGAKAILPGAKSHPLAFPFIRFEDHGAEEDMTHDALFQYGDHGRPLIAGGAKPVDDVRLRRLAERFLVQATDSRDVGWNFFADHDHGNLLKNPAGPKWDQKAVFTKKGNLARSQIPFEYCDGAEGGI